MRSILRGGGIFAFFLLSATNVSAQLEEGKAYSLPYTSIGGFSSPHIRVRLADGVPRIFALDTGAPATMIASSVARLLKLPIKTHRFTESDKTVELITSSASLGSGVLSLPEVPFILMDMSLLHKAYPDIAGIIGNNMLQFFALRFDFSRRQVDFIFEKKIAGTIFEPKDAVRVPLTYTEGHCFVDAELDGKAARFIIDTGAYQTLLESRTLIASLKPKAKIDGSTNALVNESGTGIQVGKFRKLRLHSLKIGSMEWKEPVVEENVGIREYSINSIGIDFLQRFRVIIDIPGRMLYLSPDPSFKEVEREWHGVGLELGFNNSNRIYVMNTLKPSPASEAGIMEGAEVLEVDGHPLPDLKPAELIDWWQKKQRGAEEVSLKLKSGTRIRVVVLKVKQLL